MHIRCPKCKNEFEFNETQPMGGKIKCPECNSLLSVKKTIEVSGIQEETSPISEKASDFRGPAGAKPTDKRKILVAIDGETVENMINVVLINAGFEVINATDGKKALNLLMTHRPILAILDVALPQIFGFEVSEIIKKSEYLKNTFVILVASIYHPAKYKREPQSLFSADDYIEKHHIRDFLIPKIKQLLGKDMPRPETEEILSTGIEIGPAAIDQEAAVSIIKEHEKKKIQEDELPIPPSDPVLHEKARRFARIIVSDIALYNQKAVEEGIKNGTFYDILKSEVAEGRRIYKERVPNEIYESTNYLEEALEDFIKKKRQSLMQLQSSASKEQG